MDLYLIRHGIAVDRESVASDAERFLTEKGRQRTQQVAQRLKALGVEFAQILTSPLVRAQQTADILKAVGLADEILVFDPLAPGGDFNAGVKGLETWRSQFQDHALALVGHAPTLGHWAEQFVWGQVNGKLVLKKTGVIGVRLPASGSLVGQGELFLLTSPKWLQPSE